MTSEIAIMNKRGIALATDSAVTIGKKDKIHNNITKLFMLSKYQPVGIMVYGSSEFMGVPWEIVIKEFEKELGNRNYPTLEGYVQEFIKYLSSNSLDDNSHERYYIKYYVNEFLKSFKSKFKENMNRITSNNYSELTKEELNNIYKETINECGIFQNNELDNLPLDHKQYIDKVYGIEISKMINKVLDISLISSEMLFNIKEMCILIFCKKDFSRKYSGIVIAGFGDKDIFPKLFSYEIEGKINNFVKYREVENVEITCKYNFAIIPFAKSDVIQIFLRGISSSYFNILNDAFKKEIIEEIENGSEYDISNQLVQYLNTKWTKIISIINNYSSEKYAKPILKLGPSLQIDELAFMAESFVNLTSFRSQIAMDSDMLTVGGPTDVAVISKSEGFIWIKSKKIF